MFDAPPQDRTPRTLGGPLVHEVTVVHSASFRGCADRHYREHQTTRTLCGVVFLESEVVRGSGPICQECRSRASSMRATVGK